ncbi:hypothetical protein V491_03011, partial [Pseudogymnoascus sp. VKM F-3775]
ILGRTRNGKSRLPGATDDNPLGGGLRIGKLKDAGPDADGQCHRCLTLWLFALNRVAMASGDNAYNDLAISLVRAIHQHFFLNRTMQPHLVSKMAVDMSRPLVASQRSLDPVAGYMMCRLLQATAQKGPILAVEVSDYKRVMNLNALFVSNDTLDIGMGLWISHWYEGVKPWAEHLSQMCLQNLDSIFNEEHYTERSLKYRLPFHDFGAIMGVKCYRHDEYLQARVDLILSMWEPHLDEMTEDLMPITLVMYAAALIATAFRKNGLGSEIPYEDPGRA